MSALKEFATVVIWLAILCVAIVALGQWQKFLRDSLHVAKDGEQSKRWRKVAARRTTIGVSVTWIWVLLFFAVSLLTTDHLPDKANEWGDWAAGLAAPVAFGWLVLGYLQQGDELRDNARALRMQEKALQLQVKELNASVQQQTEMADAAREQARLLDKQHRLALHAGVVVRQPRFTNFTFRSYDNVEKRIVLVASNSGKGCYEVVASRRGKLAEGVLGFETHIPYWGSQSQSFTVGPVEKDAKKLHLRISYQDEWLVQQRQEFEIDLSNRGPNNPLRVQFLGMTYQIPREAPTTTLEDCFED